MSTIIGYKGLRMRSGTPGAKVIARMGATAVLTPAADIYAALERGVIDAAEWVGPHDDMKLGLHKTARYYYYPGWHEPGTTGKKAYEGLPADFKGLLDHAIMATQPYGRAEYEARNSIALDRPKTESRGPAPVLRGLGKLAAEVAREESEKSPMAKKVYASFTKFQAQLAGWSRISEGAYHQFVAL